MNCCFRLFEKYEQFHGEQKKEDSHLDLDPMEASAYKASIIVSKEGEISLHSPKHQELDLSEAATFVIIDDVEDQDSPALYASPGADHHLGGICHASFNHGHDVYAAGEVRGEGGTLIIKNKSGHYRHTEDKVALFAKNICIFFGALGLSVFPFSEESVAKREGFSSMKEWKVASYKIDIN